jgi:hypothetical protein
MAGTLNIGEFNKITVVLLVMQQYTHHRAHESTT